jgi:hypothetical protein
MPELARQSRGPVRQVLMLYVGREALLLCACGCEPQEKSANSAVTSRLVMQGQPVLRYNTSKRTQARMMEGLLMQLRALKAAGATRMMTLHNAFTAFDAPDPGSEGHVEDSGSKASAPMQPGQFERWLDLIRKQGADPTRLMTLSAHQVCPRACWQMLKIAEAALSWLAAVA